MNLPNEQKGRCQTMPSTPRHSTQFHYTAELKQASNQRQ